MQRKSVPSISSAAIRRLGSLNPQRYSSWWICSWNQKTADLSGSVWLEHHPPTNASPWSEALASLNASLLGARLAEACGPGRRHPGMGAPLLLPREAWTGYPPRALPCPPGGWKVPPTPSLRPLLPPGRAFPAPPGWPSPHPPP